MVLRPGVRHQPQFRVGGRPLLKESFGIQTRMPWDDILVRNILGFFDSEPDGSLLRMTLLEGGLSG
jgi:hypothetical protein